MIRSVIGSEKCFDFNKDTIPAGQLFLWGHTAPYGPRLPPTAPHGS